MQICSFDSFAFRITCCSVDPSLVFMLHHVDVVHGADGQRSVGQISARGLYPKPDCMRKRTTQPTNDMCLCNEHSNVEVRETPSLILAMSCVHHRVNGSSTLRVLFDIDNPTGSSLADRFLLLNNTTATIEFLLLLLQFTVICIVVILVVGKRFYHCFQT
jgi:hypothetical protein